MAILLVFIISQGDLLESNPFPAEHRQSEKHDNFTYAVYGANSLETFNQMSGLSKLLFF